MPQLRYIRFWCSQCQDFTLHLDTCTICGTQTETYKISEIPKEKLFKQQNRYLKQKQNSVRSLVVESFFNTVNDEVGSNIQITECDAGMEKILEKRNAEYNKKENELEEERKKYSKQRRNDKCLCGSGKKYKNCHLKNF